MTTLKTASRILMGALYTAAGINHFVNPDFYLPIMPPYLPAPEALIYLSGIAEIALGIGVMIPRTARPSAWGIIAMLLVFMVVHVHMVANPQDYADVPQWALWLRLPLQGLLILWAWWYTRTPVAHTPPQS